MGHTTLGLVGFDDRKEYTPLGTVVTGRRGCTFPLPVPCAEVLDAVRTDVEDDGDVRSTLR